MCHERLSFSPLSIVLPSFVGEESLHWDSCPRSLLGMPYLFSHQHASRLELLGRTLTGDSILEGSVGNIFTSITITHSVSEAERHHKPRNKSWFLWKCRAALSDLPRSNDDSCLGRLLWSSGEGRDRPPLWSALLFLVLQHTDLSYLATSQPSDVAEWICPIFISVTLG